MENSTMAHTARNDVVVPEQILNLAPVGAGALGSVGETLLGLQRLQLETAFAWMQAIAGMQQELWDEWIAQWGGGVPLDG
jgi:hypothetical protein